jgi:pSer/pThr/pTyr-binding forkhead associated (FHA) protein
MKSIPKISVELVHIQGPMKGEIQEISDPEILIGRHSSCQVRFPKDTTYISRHHAKILREGNRFKLIDLKSRNGTFLNGQRVAEAFLKKGDVLMFADGGPKVSFLIKEVERRDEADKHIVEGPPRIERGLEQKTPVPLIIQYGPTLRSFKELPVTIGRNPSCEFVLDHPALLDRHAQIFFSRDQYWVKDLTGQQLVRLDGLPVNVQAPLLPDNRLSLSDMGPAFRFLGAGRLAEIEEQLKKTSELEAPSKPNVGPTETAPSKSLKGRGRFVKKIFQR